MLKRNKLLVLFLFALANLLVLSSCCGEPTKPHLPLCVNIIGIEDCYSDYLVDPKWFINANLYNDEISTEVLITTNDMMHPGFGIQDGDFKSDTYKGVDLKAECEALENGTGKFYALVNDPKGRNYLKDYETVRINYSSNDYDGEVYLHKKKL